MLDKVVILSCRKQAYLIFTNRTPVGVSSDVDVVPLLMWFLGFPNTHLVFNARTNVVSIEVRRDCSDEITVKINLDDAA